MRQASTRKMSGKETRLKLRQVGGSVGLAVFATLRSRNATKIRDTIFSNRATGDPETMSRLAGIKRLLVSRGMDLVSAEATATRILDGLVRKQATVLAFEKLFYLSGILFLFVIPLIFVLRAPKNAEKIEVHVEM